MCVSVSLSGSVVLGCLFAPKLHIILFQPQKNVVSHRAPTSRFSSAATRASSSLAQGQRSPPSSPWSASALPPGGGGGALLGLLGFFGWRRRAPEMRLARRGRGHRGGSLLPHSCLLCCPFSGKDKGPWIGPNLCLPFLGSGSQFVPTVCNGREVVDSTTSSL